MAFYFQKPYAPAIEQLLRQYYQSLSEKDRRRFAAVEAIRLGHGGTRYIATVLECDPHTIQEGMRELQQLPADPAGKRVRKPGGGRKKTEDKHAELLRQVEHTIQDRTAGDPMRTDVVWTDMTPQEIADSLHAQAVSVGPRIVRRILDTLGFARRQMAKVLPGGASPHRDAQFRHVSHLIHEFLEAGNPVLSIDTKKKESLGTLYRDGKVYCHQALPVFDHDLPSLARGVIIPHGIYDLAQNHGGIHVGLSHDTTAFACDSLRLFWHSDGQRLYPNASAILLLCDGGGSNSAHKHLFKEDLQGVVNDLGITIRVAHYPAYCSQFNPIERRLFSHVTRACQGVVFDSLPTVLGLLQKTKTQQGLAVTVRVLDKLYETGRKVSDAFKQHMPIVFDTVLPKWNYGAVPQRM
ncbi:MAG TPA: ISAzo13 family transposase [Candidatus Tectomicrobia bacterium]